MEEDEEQTRKKKRVRLFRFIVSDRFILGIWTITMLIPITLYGLLFAISDRMLSLDNCFVPSEMPAAAYIISIYIGSFLFIGAILLILLYRVREAYFLRRELIFACVIFGSLGLCFMIWITTPIESLVEPYFPVLFIIEFGLVAESTLSIGLPLYKTLKWESKKKEALAENELGALLRDAGRELSKTTHACDVILQDEKGKKLFREYARREFSEENIKFHDEMQIYDAMQDLCRKAILGRRIYDLYIREDGLLALNIPQSDRQSVLDYIQEWPTEEHLIAMVQDYHPPRDIANLINMPDDLFWKVKSTVQNNLRDTFTRFTESSLFREWLEHVQEQKAIRKTLKDANIV